MTVRGLATLLAVNLVLPLGMSVMLRGLVPPAYFVAGSLICVAIIFVLNLRVLPSGPALWALQTANLISAFLMGSFTVLTLLISVLRGLAGL